MRSARGTLVLAIVVIFEKIRLIGYSTVPAKFTHLRTTLVPIHYLILANFNFKSATMKNTFFLFSTIAVLLCFTQCKKEEEATGPDKELYDEATASYGFSYYVNTPNITASSMSSAHTPFMRVRFNSIAQSALDSTGKLPHGSSFPNGSLIVKELYDTQTGPLALYAIMKKDSSDANARANWLWAEIEPDMTVLVSVSKKGSGCTGCHSAGRDYTRIFDLF